MTDKKKSILSFSVVYNLTNLAGVCLIGFGFGLIKLQYGFIAAGAVVLLLNAYNLHMALPIQRSKG